MSTEIRRLLEKWREKYPAQTAHTQSADDYWAGQCRAANKLADELEALLASQRPPTADPSPADPQPEGRLMLNAYGRQCYDAGYESGLKAGHQPTEAQKDEADPGYQEALHRPVGDWKP